MERGAETGLDYRVRYMSSAQGRLTSPDELLLSTFKFERESPKLQFLQLVLDSTVPIRFSSNWIARKLRWRRMGKVSPLFGVNGLQPEFRSWIGEAGRHRPQVDLVIVLKYLPD